MSDSRRPELELLRAIAVSSVLVYHIESDWLPGGFLGVDIFFVLSGYLITQQLMNLRLETNSPLRIFYLRRARRILPSAYSVIILTLCFAFVGFPKIYAIRFLLDGLYAFLMISNFTFAAQRIDYFSNSIMESPFLHYWSLAVEEQFYLSYPILLFLVLNYVKSSKVKIVTLLSTVTSIVIAIYSTNKLPELSFYSPLTRASEFLLGTCAAIMPMLKFELVYKKWIAISFSLILISTLILSNDQLSNKTLASLPLTIATALVIRSLNPFRVPAILVFIGKISFPLYLVHWPIIVYSRIQIGNRDVSLFYGLAMVTICLFFACLIHFFVETPFRQRKWKSQLNRPIFNSVLAASIFFLSIFSLLSISQAEGISKINIQKSESYALGCHSDGIQSMLKKCTFGDSNSNLKIMLVGDSHAAHYFDGFKEASIKNEIQLTSLTKSGCPFVPLKNINNSNRMQCDLWQRKIFNIIWTR